jgi:hypothetical protein
MKLFRLIAIIKLTFRKSTIYAQEYEGVHNVDVALYCCQGFSYVGVDYYFISPINS